MDKKQQDFFDAQLGYLGAGPTLSKNATDFINKLADDLLEKQIAKKDKILEGLSREKGSI